MTAFRIFLHKDYSLLYVSYWKLRVLPKDQISSNTDVCIQGSNSHFFILVCTGNSYKETLIELWLSKWNK